jgi:hypothetical protein
VNEHQLHLHVDPGLFWGPKRNRENGDLWVLVVRP